MLRFVQNCRNTDGDREIGPLKPEEVKEAQLCISRDTQKNSSEDYAAICDGKPLSAKSKFLNKCLKRMKMDYFGVMVDYAMLSFYRMKSMIKSAKKVICAILSNADVNDEELSTAFVGVEALLNSRPLTYQTANPKDTVPLTPNHFLHGQLGGKTAPEAVDYLDYNPRQRWRRIQELINHVETMDERVVANDQYSIQMVGTETRFESWGPRTRHFRRSVSRALAARSCQRSFPWKGRTRSGCQGTSRTRYNHETNNETGSD